MPRQSTSRPPTEGAGGSEGKCKYMRRAKNINI
jgi:hypothetical protein